MSGPRQGLAPRHSDGKSDPRLYQDIAVEFAPDRYRRRRGGGLTIRSFFAIIAIHCGRESNGAADAVRELAEPDRGRITVARDAEIKQLTIDEVGAGQHRRHAPVHAVEAVRFAEKIGRRLRRAADAGELGDPVRLEIELETGLDDRGANRIMAA